MFVDNLPSRRRPFSENISRPFSEVATKCETSSREKRQDKMHIAMSNDEMHITVKRVPLELCICSFFLKWVLLGSLWDSEGEICLNVYFSLLNFLVKCYRKNVYNINVHICG